MYNVYVTNGKGVYYTIVGSCVGGRRVSTGTILIDGQVNEYPNNGVISVLS